MTTMLFFKPGLGTPTLGPASVSVVFPLYWLPPALDLPSPSTQSLSSSEGPSFLTVPPPPRCWPPTRLDTTAITSPAFPFHLSPTAYRTSQNPGIPRAERDSVDSAISTLHRRAWKPGRVMVHFHNRLKGLGFERCTLSSFTPRLLLTLPAPGGLSGPPQSARVEALAAASTSAESAHPN